MAFKRFEYRATHHAQDRSLERVVWMNREEIEALCRNGQVILETEKHRYVKSGNLRFPCIRTEDGAYVIKSVITEGMRMEAK